MSSMCFQLFDLINFFLLNHFIDLSVDFSLLPSSSLLFFNTFSTSAGSMIAKSTFTGLILFTSTIGSPKRVFFSFLFHKTQVLLLLNIANNARHICHNLFLLTSYWNVNLIQISSFSCHWISIFINPD